MANEESVDLSPRMKVTLALIQGFLPVMSAIIGGLWILNLYLDDQTKAAQARRDSEIAQAKDQAEAQRKAELALAEEKTRAETARAQVAADQAKAAADQAKAAADQAMIRLIDLRKPLLDRQFALYSKLAELSGRLSVSASHVAEFGPLNDSFRALAATELRIVGDPELLKAVAEFESAVAVHQREGGTPTQQVMVARAKDLGLAFRQSMERTWASVAAK